MKRFLSHLHEENSRFVCEPAGPPKKVRKEFPVHHQVGKEATSKQLDRLKELAGKESKDLEIFYSTMNGGIFYVHKVDAGLFIPPIGSLSKLNREMRKWIFDEAVTPEFQKKGFAFGEIVASGNYFIIYKSKIYYADHDGGGEKPFAANISKFFERIAKDPAKFFLDCGCYTRYSDGKSETQWIPERYEYG